jgi:hypothetical protein
MILASLFLPSAAIGLSLIAGGERPERKKGKDGEQLREKQRS